MYSDGWFVDKDGIHCIEENEEIDGWWYYSGSWYYFKDCIMSTGWIKIEDNWYNFNEDGKLNNSKYVNGYYLNEEGVCIYREE